MTIRFSVLGDPGRDNAVYAEVDTGQRVSRFLFDCGEDCASRLRVAQLQSLDALLLSHFHMDHVSGFDGVLRHNFNRADGFRVIGPPDTIRCVTHRLRGFTWNLVADAEGFVEVREVESDRQFRSVRLATCGGFEQVTATSSESGPVYRHNGVTIAAALLNHGCKSAGFLLREPDRLNINLPRLQSLGLRPGPWLQDLKSGAAAVEVDGVTRPADELRAQLLERTPGESLAYLTDFRPSDSEREALADWLHEVDTLICENNYCDEDRDLAVNNHHLTSTEVARLARDANAKQLVLFHLSDRYQPKQWRQQLDEVRAVFPAADWPTDWLEPMSGFDELS